MMTRRRGWLAGGCAAALTLALCLAGARPAAAASLDDDVLFIGHSLVSWTLPDMLGGAAKASGGRGRVDAQIINGAPLAYNWEHSADAEGTDARAALPTGRYEVVVMTEAVPLLTHVQWSKPDHFAVNFHAVATRARPDARVYMYESWHDLRSGTGADVQWDDHDDVSWRARLDRELPAWEGIVDRANAERAAGTPEILIVPAGQAMARMHDEIARGGVPGVREIGDLFKDDIHPNDLGFYFVAMVHYATIYGRDPSGLPRRLSSRHGQAFQAPSADLARAMQRIAWETVCAYPRSGVRCR